MPRRQSLTRPQRTLLSAAAIGVLFGGASAQAQSLCNDFNVPPQHLGNIESCVFDGASTTTINLSAPAIVQWERGFRINPDQHLRFQFNDAAPSGAVLNRDLSGTSLIQGTLTSNGRVMLLNPGGLISIQNGATIDTDGGFLASTLEVSDEEALLSGQDVSFDGPGGARSAIDNRGTIRSSAGDIVLLSGSVNNFDTGDITASNGNVYIGAGTRIRLFDGDIEVLDGDGANTVNNFGSIISRSTVSLAAHSQPGADGTSTTVVDNSGSIRTSAGPEGRVFLRAVGGSGEVLNSARGSIDTGLIGVTADSFVSIGRTIELDDGGNPAAPSATRQFPSLAGGTLSSAPADDFRLSRLSFSHLNGLESKSKKPAIKTTPRRPSTSTQVAVRSAQKPKPKPAPKKVILRRGSFFGKKTS